MTDKTPNQRGTKWLWLFVGCVGFGALMAARAASHSFWIRATVAAGAGIVLCVSLFFFRKD